MSCFFTVLVWFEERLRKDWRFANSGNSGGWFSTIVYMQKKGDGGDFALSFLSVCIS